LNALFTPFHIRNVTLRNRIVMPPMCMYSAPENGESTPWHTFHYRTRAQGGAGLIIQEATAVESRGRISAHDLGIWSDAHIPALREIVNGIKAEGAVPAIQMAHAGRKCTVLSEDVIAPSPLCFDDKDTSYKIPREMNSGDIAEVVESFKKAAERAIEAGYEILEVHGAHGYLISEFLSPLTNQRTDEFGGRMESRAGFLKLVVKAVRSVWAEERPLILRISAMDFADGGNTAEDLAEAVKAVKEEGVDLVHVSTGGVVPYAKIPAAPGYQIPSAKIIRDNTGLPVAGGGLITAADHADEILTRGDTDLIFFGRELLRDPFFPLLSARKAGVELDYWPRQYARAK